MEVRWNTAVLCAISIVYVASMKTKLVELIMKDADEIETAHNNEPTCHLKQTMAWAECGRQVKCPSTCQGHEDCTFPYCTSKGTCSCRNAFCRDDQMCHFFRIACSTNFVCREGKCFCDKLQTKIASEILKEIYAANDSVNALN